MGLHESVGRARELRRAHARPRLRDVLRDHAGDPEAFARAFHALGEDQVAPYVHAQLRTDRARVAEMDALRRGAPRPEPDPDVMAFLCAAMGDPEVFRAFLEDLMCLAAPGEVLTRPHVAEAVEARRGMEPDPPPGPDRQELLASVAG